MEKIYSPNLDGSDIGTNLSDKVTKNPLNLQLQKSNIFILLLSNTIKGTLSACVRASVRPFVTRHFKMTYMEEWNLGD